MTPADQSPEDDKKAAPASGSRQDRLEMAQRIARETLREDHHAFQVSVRSSRG